MERFELTSVKAYPAPSGLANELRLIE